MRFVRQQGTLPTDLDLESIRQAAAAYPVSLVVVFGSYADGTTTGLSDLDVAVWFEAGVDHDRRVELLGELTAAIGRATGIDAVDLIDLDAVGPAVGYEALANGVLVVGDAADAAELEATLLLRKLDFQPLKRQWDEALSERIAEGTFGRP